MAGTQFSFTLSLFVFLGSGFGGLLRYWLGSLVQNWSGSSFPFGTLTVNLSGCFIMGVLATACSHPMVIREEYRLALVVGLLGGYTTFSSFSWETLRLINDGQWWLAGLYILGSMALSLLAVGSGAAVMSLAWKAPA